MVGIFDNETQQMQLWDGNMEVLRKIMWESDDKFATWEA
jgi:hypothetical protein